MAMSNNHILPILFCCGIWAAVGCTLPAATELKYKLEATPEIADDKGYYFDSIDSTVVWSQEGLQVKVRYLSPDVLDTRYNPEYSPYTLGDWKHPRLGYTPPLFTVFEITVINRARERVELDPTQVVLRFDTGDKYYSQQGLGRLNNGVNYFDYSYLKWGSEDGNTAFHASTDRNDILSRTQYLREKPVLMGRKYVGLLSFPPPPEKAGAMTLEINDFILSFDKFEVGFGNPVEFTDMAFPFKVDQGVIEVKGEAE